MSKIAAVIETCRECPHREYESVGMYLCGKGGGQLEKNCTIPDWCPLQNYPTPTTAAQRVTSAIRKSSMTDEQWIAQNPFVLMGRVLRFKEMPSNAMYPAKPG